VGSGKGAWVWDPGMDVGPGKGAWMWDLVKGHGCGRRSRSTHLGVIDGHRCWQAEEMGVGGAASRDDRMPRWLHQSSEHCSPIRWGLS